MFDLLKFMNGKTYLYHVKKSFGQTTRDACSQLINSSKFLTGCFAGDPNQKTDPLRKFHDELKDKKRIHGRNSELFGSFEDFKEKLRNPIFVYAVATDAKKEEGADDFVRNRSLKVEKKMKFQILRSKIAAILDEVDEVWLREIGKFFKFQSPTEGSIISQEGKRELADKILEKFTAKKYFQTQDNETYTTTCKFLFASGVSLLSEFYPHKDKNSK